MEKVRVGIIGCGNISNAYLKFARTFNILEVVGLADIDASRAQARAAEHNVPRAYRSVQELLDDKAVELVINLTIPAAHAQVSLDAIAAGKHVWTEKPLATTREDGQRILKAAKAAGVRIGGAPDTFFGAGHQTARKLIDAGAIGIPVAATAFMLSPGHERWHPNPEFFYKPGGGPMFDMGPYYITALMQLLGPMKRLTGFAKITRPTRTISSEPLKGTVINVETPDHVTGCIEYVQGAIATIVTSFGTWHPTYDSAHPITVFGTEGTMQVPDPNGFDGTVLLRGAKDAAWREMPFEHNTGYGRAVGAADMAYGIRTGRPHRASAEQIYAALDAMQAFIDSSESGKTHTFKTRYDRPAPLPVGLPAGELDA